MVVFHHESDEIRCDLFLLRLEPFGRRIPFCLNWTLGNLEIKDLISRIVVGSQLSKSNTSNGVDI